METKFLIDSVGHYGFNDTSCYNFQQQDFIGKKLKYPQFHLINKLQIYEIYIWHVPKSGSIVN